MALAWKASWGQPLAGSNPASSASAASAPWNPEASDSGKRGVHPTSSNVNDPHDRRRSNPRPRGPAGLFAEEGVYVSGEFGVVLEEESVGRVRVDLDFGVRDEAGEQVGEMRQDHRVAVAVGDEDRNLDRAHPL